VIGSLRLERPGHESLRLRQRAGDAREHVAESGVRRQHDRNTIAVPPVYNLYVEDPGKRIVKRQKKTT
jgi:hypothetical protein